LNKLAELISQKLLYLEEQLFEIILNLTVIWYNPTYAHTYAFNKPPKKTRSSCLLLQFSSVFIIFFVRLRKSLTHNALAPFSWNFAFGGQKHEKTKSKNFEMVSLGGSVKRYLLHQFERYSFGSYCIWKHKTCLTMH
jgi:hypothetical protein